MRQKTIGIIFILAAAMLFGVNGSLSRLLFDNGVTPVTLVEFRMVIGGLCLFGFLCIQQRRALKLPRRAFGLDHRVWTFNGFGDVYLFCLDQSGANRGYSGCPISSPQDV